MRKRKETANAAFDAILKAKGLSLVDVSSGTKVALNTLGRIRRMEPVRHASLLAVAGFLGVKPADIYPIDRIQGNG